MTSDILPIIPAVYDVLFDFAQSDGFWANLERSAATPRKKHLTETIFSSPLHSLHATNESFSQYHYGFDKMD